MEISVLVHDVKQEAAEFYKHIYQTAKSEILEIFHFNFLLEKLKINLIYQFCYILKNSKMKPGSSVKVAQVLSPIQ